MTTPNSTRRIAIIGGGITGLSAALRLSDIARERQLAIDVTLLDNSDRLGGVLKTERIGEYLVEHAADMWITNKPEGVRLCERLGLAERLVPTDAKFRRSFVLRNGTPYAVPEGFQLMVPEQAWPMLRSPLLSWRGKLRMLSELFVSARRDGADESLSDFVCRRFGREAFERLVQPLVGGIYTADPEKLSLKATLPRFIDMERTHGSLIRAALAERRSRKTKETGTSGARYGLFVSLPNGLQELMTALIEQVKPNTKIRLQTAVQSVHRNELGRFVVASSSVGSSSSSATSLEEFDAVVIAVPAFVASRLVKDDQQSLADELSRIEYASTVVVASGHKLSDIQHPLNAFGMVIPHIERRKILAVSFTSRKFPGRAPDGHVLLRTFVGGALQSELNDLNDDGIMEIVRDELHDILGVRWNPDFAVALRHTRAMPQYHVGHLDVVSRIEAQLTSCRGLALAGSYLRGVGIPDSIGSGECAAERVLSQVVSEF